MGIALCTSLLQKDQLRLFNRGLTANKLKKHLISPCLRLLTEIVSFDGGALASAVWSRRYMTFKRLELFLTLDKAPSDHPDEKRHNPSVRRIAQRYVLANLKFQSVTAKTEIIGQGKLIDAFLKDVKKDARDIITDILSYLRNYIVNDGALSRSCKTRFLNARNLGRLATLYGYETALEESQNPQSSIPDLIHQFLLLACTNAENGILVPKTGWYPVGNSQDNVDSVTSNGNVIDVGLDFPSQVERYQDSVPVQNGTLAKFIHGLRPDSDTRQSNLLLEIFKAAPELVADYFSKKKILLSDPQPTPSWLGQSAFLFSVVQLPIPTSCDWGESLPRAPPPTAIVIESILPRPLNQKLLSRCLNLNTDVITLFALRLTTIAFQKLQNVLRIYRSGKGSTSSLWNQAPSKLVAEFCRRCPVIRDVIALFRNTNEDSSQQREAVIELLYMYYRVTPHLALDEKFDVSLVIVDILERINDTDDNRDHAASLLNQLQYLLEIAHQSLGVRWWQKPGMISIALSPSRADYHRISGFISLHLYPEGADRGRREITS